MTSNQIDRIVQRVSRLAVTAVVLGSIGGTTALWAWVAGDAPLLVQLLGVPIGAVIGLALVRLAFVIDGVIERRSQR